VAQIAITALSLPYLSNTHWVSRAFLNISLLTALMSVYYASTQHRILGTLLKPAQIRSWIRGGSSINRGNYPNHTFPGRNFSTLGIYNFFMATLINYPMKYEPSKFSVDDLPDRWIKSSLINCCFMPSAAAVLTISAPHALLSSSLFSLFIALGIYFGFVWTRNLDQNAGVHDSRNVFILYMVVLGVCLLVYSLSSLIQDQDDRSERAILEDHVRDFVTKPENQDLVNNWGVMWNFNAHNEILLVRIPQQHV